jgi:hypothetical protein
MVNAQGARAESLPIACASFTDDPITAQTTELKGSHFTELRSCIDALRTQVGLEVYAWADSTITPGVTLIRVIHLTELRNALSDIYAFAGLYTPTYTDSLTVESTMIKAVHIAELRTAARALDLPTADAPQFAPVPGTYYLEQAVSTSVSTTGSVIRYTVDGTDPTNASAPYFSPIAVTQTTTIRSRTFSDGHLPSGISTAVYALQVAPPTFAPVPGSYTGTQEITIQSITSNVTVYYTTDGNEPTTSSQGYIG